MENTLNYNEGLIKGIEEQLQARGVLQVPQFIRKLRDNAKEPLVIQDLLVEAEAALTFREYGFAVTMRDRPDLDLTYGGVSCFVECKHFRRRQRDETDRERLERAFEAGTLVEYGQPANVQEQVLAVLDEKAREYSGAAPFIVLLKSSSELQVDRNEIGAAINIAEEVVSDESQHPLSRVSAVLFRGCWYNIRHRREVHLFPLRSTGRPIARLLWDAFDAIACWTVLE